MNFLKMITLAIAMIALTIQPSHAGKIKKAIVAYGVAKVGKKAAQKGVEKVIAWSTKGRLKTAGLPHKGKLRYVPPKGYSPSSDLPRGPQGGYIDRKMNEWVKGPSRTQGDSFEWDVQLSRQGKSSIGWASRDKSHVNVSPLGRITHK